MDHYLNYHNRMVHGKPLFQFTRHATSCFNVGLYTAAQFTFKKGIPSLPHYGIVHTISLARKNTTRFQSSVICVSNLVRTWMTAILLYTLSNKKSITLRICPHLREYGGIGFRAYPLTDTIPVFMRFLKVIKKFPSYRHLREIILLVPSHPNNYHGWIPIRITIPEYDITPPVCHIIDPLLEKGYTEKGNISTFMKWYHTSFPQEQGKVHVIAHSGIMKDYIEEKAKGQMIKGIPFHMKTYTISQEHTKMNGKPIENQNCWSFTTYKEQVNAEKLLESIQSGYLNPEKDGDVRAIKKEERKRKDSLCLKEDVPIKCSTKSQRRTKKNKIHKK
jgi:hypothetical protein